MSNKIDWSKAPEGAEHWFSCLWYKETPEGLFVLVHGEWRKSHFTLVDIMSKERCISKPQENINTDIKLETLLPPVVITLQGKERVQSLLNVLHCALNAQESDNYVDGIDKATATEIQEYLEKVLNEHK